MPRRKLEDEMIAEPTMILNMIIVLQRSAYLIKTKVDSSKSHDEQQEAAFKAILSEALVSARRIDFLTQSIKHTPHR